jgi:hypothetical protein
MNEALRAGIFRLRPQNDGSWWREWIVANSIAFAEKHGIGHTLRLEAIPA